MSVHTPKPALHKLDAMNSYGDHLVVDQIPDSFGLTLVPEFRKKIRENKPKATANNYIEPTKVVVVMVGLPARGKSYTAKKIMSYFRWLGITAKIFNVGVYRRKVLRDTIDQSATFFEASNLPARRIREKLALEVLDQLFEWLESEGGQIAIFDATNTTNERRRHIITRVKAAKTPVQLLFIENICDDAYVLSENFKQKVLISPDYQSLSVEGASHDLKRRIINYEKVYESITDDTLSYIKVINLKSKVILNKISGTVPKMLTDYVMKLHIQSRSIWFTRPGISEATSTEFTEGDVKYAQKLTEFILKKLDPKQLSSLIIFTGTSNRLLQMANYMKGLPAAASAVGHNGHTSKNGYASTPSLKGVTIIPTTTINTLDAGICHQMTSEEISAEYPAVWKALQDDRFNYRPPEGESFADLIQRLRPFILELEQLAVPVLIISHAAPILGLYTYFKEIDVETAPYFHVPKQIVIELTSTGFGWKEKHYSIM